MDTHLVWLLKTIIINWAAELPLSEDLLMMQFYTLKV